MSHTFDIFCKKARECKVALSETINIFYLHTKSHTLF